MEHRAGVSSGNKGQGKTALCAMRKAEDAGKGKDEIEIMSRCPKPSRPFHGEAF